jgi:hypothetical protein
LNIEMKKAEWIEFFRWSDYIIIRLLKTTDYGFQTYPGFLQIKSGDSNLWN